MQILKKHFTRIFIFILMVFFGFWTRLFWVSGFLSQVRGPKKSDFGYPTTSLFRSNITNQEEKMMRSFLVEYAQKNMITLKIFFRDSYYTKMKRDVAITKVTFVSNTGGLLGLCLGLSFVSIFEIFYHLIQVFSCKPPSQNIDSIFPSQNQVWTLWFEWFLDWFFPPHYFSILYVKDCVIFLHNVENFKPTFLIKILV